MRESLWIFLILLQQHCGQGEIFVSSHIPHTPNFVSGESHEFVKRATKDPFSRRSALDKHFIRFGRSGDYFHDQSTRSQKNVNSYARVSRAAQDNFMRFGRPNEGLEKFFNQLGQGKTAVMDQNEEMQRQSRSKDSFMRFGKANKDNFMRFGRKDNFMRFGRGKDNFMRFGRGKDNFMRFGRGKDNFMRFGRAKDNFMRFGRGKDNFMRFGRNYLPDPNGLDDAIDTYGSSEQPTGKKQTKSLKNQTGFIRFGRSDPEADPEDQKIDDDDSEIVGGLDLQADKPKNGPVIRNKREAQNTLWDLENSRSRRDIEVMDAVGVDAKDIDNDWEVQKRNVDLESYLDPDQDFIVSKEDLSQFLSCYSHPMISLKKRNSGGSNFIRFG